MYRVRDSSVDVRQPYWGVKQIFCDVGDCLIAAGQTFAPGWHPDSDIRALLSKDDHILAGGSHSSWQINRVSANVRHLSYQARVDVKTQEPSALAAPAGIWAGSVGR